MNKIFSFLLVFTLIFSSFGVATPTAEARCSNNGYWNSNGKCSRSYDKKPKKYSSSFNYSDDFLERYIEQLERLIELLRLRQFDNNSDIDVTTRTATHIDEDSATLRGEVDVDGDEADVFFEYGRTRTNLNEDTNDITIDDNDDEDFDIRIHNLREDTLYYFRAVAEDEDGDRDYGSILSFRTDDDSNNDTEPSLDTRNATDITDDSAELRGTVDMEDFNNGRVFFIYGEDEDEVDDVEDDFDQYTDVDENGDDLQKTLLDNDLDGEDDYDKEVGGLDNNTRIYHNICVEYEDEDGDDTIDCGTTRSFETDN